MTEQIKIIQADITTLTVDAIVNAANTPLLAPNISTRCPVCRMHVNLCVCAFMPHYDLATKIIIFMQRTEHRIISSTAHYIPKIFKNAEIRIRGGVDKKPMDTSGIINEQTQPMILYPTDDAKVLSAEFVSMIKKPISLIVPDGSWRQTMRIVRRLDPDKKIPRVILPPGPVSNYRLRTSRKMGGVCTFEAIARALGVIEGKEVQEKLEAFFDAMVERVLWTRGRGGCKINN